MEKCSINTQIHTKKRFYGNEKRYRRPIVGLETVQKQETAAVARSASDCNAGFTELIQFHPIQHPLVFPRIEKHTVGIAAMHLEHFWIDFLAGLLTHAHCAFF